MILTLQERFLQLSHFPPFVILLFMIALYGLLRIALLIYTGTA